MLIVEQSIGLHRPHRPASGDVGLRMHTEATRNKILVHLRSLCSPTKRKRVLFCHSCCWVRIPVLRWSHLYSALQPKHVLLLAPQGILFDANRSE